MRIRIRGMKIAIKKSPRKGIVLGGIQWLNQAEMRAIRGRNRDNTKNHRAIGVSIYLF
jgi:hypothetical protein